MQKKCQLDLQKQWIISRSSFSCDVCVADTLVEVQNGDLKAPQRGTFRIKTDGAIVFRDRYLYSGTRIRGWALRKSRSGILILSPLLLEKMVQRHRSNVYSGTSSFLISASHCCHSATDWDGNGVSKLSEYLRRWTRESLQKSAISSALSSLYSLPQPTHISNPLQCILDRQSHCYYLGWFIWISIWKLKHFMYPSKFA